MSLTYKDALTTVLAVGVGGIYYIQSKGLQVPVLSSTRWSAAVLLIIGVLMCAFGAYNFQSPGAWSNPWAIFAMVLGIGAFVIGLIGLVTGTKVFALGVASMILVLWFATIVRHLFI